MRIVHKPLFLARAVYRKRRLRDAARMLPIFGFLLLMLPMLWPQGRGVAWTGWIYVFLVWAALIVAAAALARGLAAPDAPPTTPEGGDSPPKPEGGDSPQKPEGGDAL